MTAYTSQDITTSVVELLNLFSCEAIEHAHALIPNPETPGNPAVVITARDGSQYGLEVCPIPVPLVLPESPTGAPELTDREEKGCTHSPDEPCFGRRIGSGDGGAPRD